MTSEPQADVYSMLSAVSLIVHCTLGTGWEGSSITSSVTVGGTLEVPMWMRTVRSDTNDTLKGSAGSLT